MLLKTIQLENIRSYVNEKIEFPEGSILLNGDIGSGKSTILLAIEFALFGINPGTGEMLLRKGKKEASVELKLEIDQKEVTIKRILKRTGIGVKQEAGHIITNEIKKDLTPLEMQSEILDLLGYPAELRTKSKSLIFNYTVYTPQESMKHIILEKAEERLDILRRIFDIDKYKRIRENANIFSRQIKTRLIELETKIEGLDRLEKEKKELKEKIENIKKILIPQQQELEKIKNEKKKINIELNDIELAEKEKITLRNSLEIIKTKIEAKNNEIKKQRQEEQEIKFKLAQLEKEKNETNIDGTEEELKVQIKEYETRINEIKNKKITIGESIMLLNKSIKEATEKIKQKQQHEENLKIKLNEINLSNTKKYNIEELQKERILIDKEKTETAEKISELNANIKNAVEITQKISSLNNCPTCKQNVASDYKTAVITTEKTKIGELNTQIIKYKEIQTELDNKKEEIERKVIQTIEEDKKLVSLKKDVDILQERIENINIEEEKINKLNLEKNIKTKELEEINLINEEKINDSIENLKHKRDKIILRDNVNKQIDESTSKIINLKEKLTLYLNDAKIMEEQQNINKDKLEKMPDYSKKIEELKTKKDEKETEEKRLLIETTSLNERAENLTKNLAKIDEEILIKEHHKKENIKQTQLLNWIENYFVKLMQSIEKNVMLKLYNEFNQVFQNWLKILISDENISARLDDSFAPIIIQNGYEIDISHLSGGEKTACALAYRLALNKVINDFIGRIRTKDLLILDEPTDGFSQEQLDKMRDVLDELRLRQIIIVSHDAKIESFVNNTIKIVKDNHISKVISV